MKARPERRCRIRGNHAGDHQQGLLGRVVARDGGRSGPSRPGAAIHCIGAALGGGLRRPALAARAERSVEEEEEEEEEGCRCRAEGQPPRSGQLERQRSLWRRRTEAKWARRALEVGGARGNRCMGEQLITNQR